MSFIPNELRDFLASRLLLNLARHLVMVFVPLLLLEHGLVLWQVFVFYAVSAGLSIPLCRVAVSFINRFGERAGFLVGYGAVAAYHVLLGLYVGEVSAWVFYLIPVALAVSDMFILVDNTIHVSRAIDDDHNGGAMALIQFLAQLASAAGPWVGAYVAVHAGVAWLAVTAAALMTLSLVPIWRIGRQPGAAASLDRISYRPLPPRRDLLANFSFQWFADVGMMVWPVYLAIVTPGYRKIGGILSVGLILGLGLVVVVGKLVNRRRQHLAVWLIIALISAINLIRLASHNAVWLTALTAVFAALFSCFNVAWFGNYYELCRKEGVNYILAMETIGTTANCVLWTALGVMSYFSAATNPVFLAAFASSALAVWGCLLLRRAS